MILLDEIDKMSHDFKGDPSSAMLEVLDAEQNKEFRDHYLELPYDLSDVMFITTANYKDAIPGPLLDRMEVIDISGYTEEEKINIASKYIVPKQLSLHGVSTKIIRFDKSAIREIVVYYTREAGVRNLEREIATVIRKAIKRVVTENKTSVRITKTQQRTIWEQENISMIKPMKLMKSVLSEVLPGLLWEGKPCPLR